MGLQARTVDQNDADRHADDAKQAQYVGLVIWYNRIKGHGFIALEGYPRDVFVHNTAVRAGDMPRDYLLKGDKVRCKVGLHEGRVVCFDLEMVDAAG